VASLLFGQDATAWRDPSPHQMQMIAADTDVQLEVLDWGGHGRPVVLLAGFGNTAHIFDDLGPKLAENYHVYGITRRGFGASSRPDSGYDAYRLGDDVLAVLDTLKLVAPVLAGHSIAGEELSSVATRHPDRVAGLVYLDAIYPYAFDNGHGWTTEELLEIEKGFPPPSPPGPADLASVAALREWTKKTLGVAYPEGEVHGRLTWKPSKAPAAVFNGTKKFTDLTVPILAICAFPQDLSAPIRATDTPEKRSQMEAMAEKAAAGSRKQIAAFETAIPGARVVKMANAHHYVFLSNEPDVLREMNRFLQTLK
jgi:pimeloyl-ACP methyl ester carboxylesterase